MTGNRALERGRRAYERREWAAACRLLAAADAEAAPGGGGGLGVEDLWRLAMASLLAGRDEAFLATMERAHRRADEAGEAVLAARCAFWLGFTHLNRGEWGPGSGWLGRASRQLDRTGGDHVERGYLLIPPAHERLESGDASGARSLASEAVAIGERFRDADLLALAVHLQGRTLVAEGRVAEGLSLMDEAMVGVSRGEVSPVITGLVYCSVISACRQVYALARAHEWTAALEAWCEAQPDLIPYRGECRVYRSEILQLHGDWDGALAEARRAAESATGPAARGAASLAWYQQGELFRLRGELAAAESAYGRARELGREPQPGLALLRLAQGDAPAAWAAIRRTLVESVAEPARVRLLPAAVEIAVATGQLESAREACSELESLAASYGTDVMATMAAQARGRYELAVGGSAAALPSLRQAARGWQALGAPYEAARVRVLLAAACRRLGDADTASLELEAARATFRRLGAAMELASPGGPEDGGREHGLTPRELEVLRLLAAGRTNRTIAGALFISEKTVARHVSNIFSKLGLSNRSEAAAYAHRHELT